MAQFVIPESFARQNGFISPDAIALTRPFTFLGKLFNKKGIHVGMIFDKQIGLNSRFQFEFDGDTVSFTEEGQSQIVWETYANNLQIQTLNPVSNQYEYKPLSSFKTTADKVQAILNCLGNAFDLNTTATTTYTEPTSYEVADDFRMYVPGGVGFELQDENLKKLKDLNANFDGLVNGAKSLICSLNEQVLQVFTGTARIHLDMTHDNRSFYMLLQSLKSRGYGTKEIDNFLAGMQPTDGIMSITSRKNDGTYPGGLIINISMPGVDNETIVLGTFKELYGDTIEYPGIYGSGEDPGIPGGGGGTDLPIYDGIEEPLM